MASCGESVLGQLSYGEEPAISYIDPNMSARRRAMVRVVERLTGQRKLKQVYDGFREAGGQGDFWDEMIRRTGIRLDFNREALDRMPRQGPLLVVANHPYGLLDGFALCWLASRVRPDFKLIINSVLVQAPETREQMLPVDFSGNHEALEMNLASRAAARRHLAQGGAVLVFPAGGISTAPDRLGRRPAMDAPWQAFVGQLVQRAKCPVLPIYFEGQNSRLFQMVSHWSSAVRLALMAGECRRRFGKRLGLRIGEVIPFAALEGITGRKALASELCRRTYALGGIDTTRPGVIVPGPKVLQDKPLPRARKKKDLGERKLLVT